MDKILNLFSYKCTGISPTADIIQIKIWLPTAGQMNLYEGACPNCLEISKKFFRVPTWILKIKIKVWEPSITIMNYCITINA